MDHVHSGINGFYESVREITNASFKFCSRPFKVKKRRQKK